MTYRCSGCGEDIGESYDSWMDHALCDWPEGALTEHKETVYSSTLLPPPIPAPITLDEPFSFLNEPDIGDD
jgi:hypothetical protein